MCYASIFRHGVRSKVLTAQRSYSIQILHSDNLHSSEMADRFKPPSIDWISPGDVLKRFKIFKQKCELIFAGPPQKVEEAKKVRLLLLWVNHKGLEIYNTKAWQNDGDGLKLQPVLAALEAYTKPQSNQILSRYQLRCLKQGDMPLEEFVTKTRLLIGDGGYDPAAKETTLTDTLVFGVTSDKVRKDVMALGNSLTFKQVYDLAKVDESTKAQMKIISKGDDKTDLHTVQSESTHSSQKPPTETGPQAQNFLRRPTEFN